MSSRDMTINQIKAADKEFGAKHTILVKGFKDAGGNHKGRKTGSKNRITIVSVNSKVDKLSMTLDKLATIVEQLAKEVHEGFAKQEQFNQFVIDQFKNHGWIK